MREKEDKAIAFESWKMHISSHANYDKLIIGMDGAAIAFALHESAEVKGAGLVALIFLVIALCCWGWSILNALKSLIANDAIVRYTYQGTESPAEKPELSKKVKGLGNDAYTYREDLHLSFIFGCIAFIVYHFIVLYFSAPQVTIASCVKAGMTQL